MSKRWGNTIGQIIDILNEADDRPQKRFKVKKNHGCAVAALISPPLIETRRSTPRKKCRNLPTETTPKQASPGNSKQ